MANNNRLGELLVREKLISLSQLRHAQDEQQKSGQNLGYTLAKLGYVSDDEITSFLSQQYRVPTVNLEEYEIDPEILKLRLRQQRNFLTTLFISQGTPMLLGGDERGRSQRGNNNAWCQDSELSWYLWGDSAESAALHRFTQRLLRLRAEHCTFRRETFLRGQAVSDDGPLPDVWWFRPDGRKMTGRDWEHGEAVLGMFLNGDAIPTPGIHGERITDDSFVMLFNAHDEAVEFVLPRKRMGARWELELCTEDPEAAAGSRSYGPREQIVIPHHSITILRRV